eukprot:14896294-Alexandrium_andersonii.AAC.1
MRGGPFDREQKRFDQWSATLYEARWHETIKFVRKLKGILGLFRAVWSRGKFEAGVDSSSVAFRERGSRST